MIILNIKESNYWENSNLNKAIEIVKQNKGTSFVPCSCSFNENDYWNYAYKYKKEILNYFKESYIVIKHSHNDIYVHETPYENVDKILNDGYLIGTGEHNSLGKGVYTFPLKSGRVSALRNNSFYIVFSSNEEHCHIVGTDDSNHELGEANFLTDKLKILNPKIYSQKEILNLSKIYFNPNSVLRDYYGIDSNDYVTYGNLCEIVSKYN